MVEFKLRLLDEANELEIKINKLHDFLYSQVFNACDAGQKTLLREQYKVMRQYLNILKCRIDLLLTEEDKKEIENGNN